MSELHGIMIRTVQNQWNIMLQVMPIWLLLMVENFISKKEINNNSYFSIRNLILHIHSSTIMPAIK